LTAANLDGGSRVHFIDPVGFVDFVALEKHAGCVLSDSGTVQEECAILGVRNVTLRDATERPETIECGSNVLTGCDAEMIASAVAVVLSGPPQWKAPSEYLAPCVSETVLRIMTGYMRGLPSR